MKIFIINPDYGMTKEELDERCAVLQSYVGADVTLHMECLQTNKVYLDSQLEIALASSEIVGLCQRAEKEGYDAVVLYCFSDPALEACKEVVSIPVVGAGQASFLTALMVSRKFGLVVAEKQRIAEKEFFAYQTGISPERLGGICAIDLHGKSIREDMAFTCNQLEATCKVLIEETGVQAIVLGCLSFLGMAEELSKKMGIPVVDSATVAVGAAEFLARQNIQISKISYPLPSRGTRTWGAGKFHI